MQPMPPEKIPGAAAGGPRPPAAFPDRHKEAFTGLAYVGALTDTVRFAGHEIAIRTLTSDEVLAAALVTRDWAGTIGQPRAHSTAMAGLCVVSVDGQPMPVPLGEGDDDGPVPPAYDWCLQRFNYVKAKWYQWTIDAIYMGYLDLEDQVREVLDAMEKARAPAGPTPGSSTSAESSSGAGS
jgi:hypothetical protein